MIFDTSDDKGEESSDLSLEKIQQNIGHYGTTIQVWKDIENVENDSSGEMTLSLEEASTNLDKFVLLLEQAFQSAAYNRHYNALSSVMKDQKR